MPLFQSFVSSVRKRVVDEVSKRMEQAGAQAVSYAKDLVPKDTHATENSIGYYWSREEMKLVIYAGTSYAYWLEVGNFRTPARPYLRPAMLQVGRVFGTSTAVQFESLPAKYHGAAKRETGHLKRPGVVIGHRPRRR